MYIRYISTYKRFLLDDVDNIKWDRRFLTTTNVKYIIIKIYCDKIFFSTDFKLLKSSTGLYKH